MSCALLIAEPEPETGGFLERHLAEDGFEVLRTEDGEAALSLAEQVRPDVVLLGGELDVCRACPRASRAARGIATCR